jgi:hypothetical protein
LGEEGVTLLVSMSIDYTIWKAVVCGYVCVCLWYVFHVAYNVDDGTDIFPYFMQVVANHKWFLKVHGT